jgi:CheY-like chemotaxis protein
MARERRVLLVEDDPHLRSIYLEQLRKDGIPLEAVATGKEADRFVRDRVPVLVLIDLALPDMNGRQLIESWSLDPLLSAIPVWIVSNSASEEQLWWHDVPNVQRYFTKSRVVLPRLSLEIRATLGLPYGERLSRAG